MRIAVLGGSFNPVHIGHLALADAVHVSFGYDRVLLVPANIPPHKEMADGTTTEGRLEMLSLATAGADWLETEDCEISRGGLSYTIDTLEYLCGKYASVLEGKIGLVIGEDLVDGFMKWKNPESIASIADIIVAQRPGIEKSLFPLPHIPLVNPLLSISSSEIRACIRSGKSWRYLVPDPVYRYIVEHTLYEYRPV